MNSLRTLLPAAALLAASCSLGPGNGYAPTPQRPTLSSDTSTTYAGSLEVEAGFYSDPGDEFAIPTTLKYGINETTEAFLGVNLFRSVDAGGVDDSGFGDLLLGARHRFWEDERGPSAAGQLAVKFPTADESAGLGSGEPDLFAAGIFSTTLEDDISVTGYAEFGLLGDPTGGTDLQQLLAIAPSVKLNEELTLFGEFSYLLLDGGPDPALLILGLARSLDDAMVADFGVVLGVNDEAADFAIFAGITANLGPVVGDRRDTAGAAQPVRATP